jgi:signal transduction histidine kinase/CheY-like chemotaxis protein
MSGVAILLVEDNPDDVELLGHILAEQPGQRVTLTTAETLRDGLAALERDPVDLMLLDLSLPDSFGVETVRRARAGAPHVPIIVLTGAEDDELGVRAIHAGAQDYVPKAQLDGVWLRRSIQYAIERHRLLAERTEDAQVFAALARVGEALIGGVRAHTMLDQLCRVTAEVLGCAVTSTWMLDENREAYVAAAANVRGEWNQIRRTRVPRAALAVLGDASGADRVLHRLDDALRGRLPDVLLRMPRGVTADLCLTLRQGDDLSGVLVCGYRGGAGEWTRVHERVAAGLVHIAALALDNARLVSQLEESNAIKTYFAATMSHELRNTVFAIGGYSDMILDAVERADPGEAARLARAVGGRSRESLQLIQAALEVTRSEAQAPPAEARELSVPELLEQVRRDVETVHNGRAPAVQWRVAPGVPVVRTDGVKLRMVLKNLVGNAIKFTKRGEVQVSAEAAGDRVRLTVSDTGIGIPAEELPHIFEPFRQAHARVSRNAGGAGLGLFIVRRLVELLGGTIAVESSPGEGTTFAVEIPLGPPGD